MSTHKSSNFVGTRLEALKGGLVLTWGDLANRLEISRAMLDFLRNGDRNPSPKMLLKIEEAEIAAGLRNPKSSSIVRDLSGRYETIDLDELDKIADELSTLSARIRKAIGRKP